MRRANYAIVLESDDCVLIRDIGPHDQFFTVTNAAEEVVAELAPMLRGRRLEYYDSDGDRDQLLVQDGKFAGFVILPSPAGIPSDDPLGN